MKQFLCGLATLGLLAGAAVQAMAQGGYVFTPIDPPGSPAGSAGDHTWGINNAGQIVGSYNFGFVTAGFLYSGGSYTTLPQPQMAFAEGINNLGQIVGSDGYSGFLLNGGSLTPIQVPGVISTTPHGMNDNGQIVGSYPLGAGDHGFLYSAGRFTTFDVPGAAAEGTLALGINNAGQIVGWYGGRGNISVHGFVLINGTYTTIDAPGAVETFATAISNSGQILVNGWFYNGTGGVSPHPYLLEDGRLIPFEVPGSGVAELLGINDLGQIVGVYGDANGDHGFLATPVPEPSTLLLAAIGMVGAFGCAWWRRDHALVRGRTPVLAGTGANSYRCSIP
jgi:uncharacterized membrane protein